MTTVTPPAPAVDATTPQTAGLTVTQALDNRSFASAPITSNAFAVGGNPLLVSSSASGYTPTANGVIGAQVQVTSAGTPAAAGTPTVFINPANSHAQMVDSWMLVPGVPASAGATVTVSATGSTTVDSNDFCCLTLYELGPDAPLAVRAATGPQAVAPGQAGVFFSGGVMLYQPFMSFGGRLVIRVAGSAIPPVGLGLTTLVVDLDGEEIARAEVCAKDNAGSSVNWHDAVVPVSVLVDAAPGPHALVVRALDGTTPTRFDYHDWVSALVLEQMPSPEALAISPLLVNAACEVQTGGGVAASTRFSSAGGTLVIWAAASASASGTANTLINLNLMLDGQPLKVGAQQAALSAYTNLSATGTVHLGLVSNDLVLEGIAPGNHLLELIGDKVTTTDGNDRCSLTVLELGPAGA
jgi:hypothetical protein